jgi:predicted kinase
MEKVIVIVRGVPGSGKTTFAELIGRAICTADDYFTDSYGSYNWTSDNVGKAHSWCQRKCERFLKKSITPVIVANTSTTERELRPYYDLARRYGYKVFSVIVENRHNGENTHGVPEATLEKMENRFNIKLR